MCGSGTTGFTGIYEKERDLGEAVRPDSPAVNDLSAPQDKLGCKPLLINLARCPPIIKDQGCLLSSYFNRFVWFRCSRCFVTLPTGATVG